MSGSLRAPSSSGAGAPPSRATAVAVSYPLLWASAPLARPRFLVASRSSDPRWREVSTGPRRLEVQCSRAQLAAAWVARVRLLILLEPQMYPRALPPSTSGAPATTSR
jgi:hypothetical protein